jgi:hypothetical protein
MESGENTRHDDPSPNSLNKIAAPRLAGVVFSEESATNATRTLFLREVERATPEVLEQLRDRVWPEYSKASTAIQRTSYAPVSIFFPSQSATRNKAVVDCAKAMVDWAKDVRLIHGDGPPNWIVQQVETTLQIWTRHPDWVSERPGWLIFVGQQMERRRPQDYLIEFPQFTWYWLYGYESAWDAKKRILGEVTNLVDRRLAEMKVAIDTLPRVPTKSKPEHFTWTVLHQIKGVHLKDLADQSRVSPATVKNAVMGLKKRLGISLPKGRPKRNSID